MKKHLQLLTFSLALILVSFKSMAVDITVQLLSYVAVGGPTIAAWSVVDENEMSVASGTANFSSFVFQYTTTVSVEPGCYTLVVQGNTAMNDNNFLAGILIEDEVLLPSELIWGNATLWYSFCTEILEPTCTACFTPMVYMGELTINNCSTPVDAENTSFTWDFGDGSTGDGPMPVHQYLDNGVYQVCVVMIVVDNEGLVTCISDQCEEIVVEGLTENDCPNEIWNAPGDLCGMMQFEIAGFIEGEEVAWWFGDSDEQIIGGHYITHQYVEPGSYLVCAFYTSNICPDGVEICTEIFVEECGNNCDGTITVNYNCPDNLVYLYVAGWAENTPVSWNVNGIAFETPYNWLTLEANGEWINVCAWSNNCPEICQEIYIQDCGGNDCDLVVEQIGGFECEYLILQAFEFPEGANVHWTQNGIQVNEGNITTFILEPGINQLCAWYEFEGCGAEWCETYIGCGEECDAFVTADQVNCNHWVFNLNAEFYDTNIFWTFNDGNDGTWGGLEIAHEFGPGTYEVCASWASETCGEQTECITIVVEGCDNNCPDYLTAEQIDCNSFLFHVAGVDGGNVVWTFGDGGGETSGPGADHSYESDGIYIVTATYSSELCESVVLIFTVWVDCENTNDCPDEIWSGAGDECGVMLFEIGSFVQGESVVWYPGDESGAQEGSHFWAHTYAEPGVYTVCAYYTSPLCNEGVELCTEIVVESCEGGGDCPEVIWHSENDCGHFSFEIGSFAEGESVDWYVGEYLAEENGGHFWQAAFEIEGWITVCAFYTSNDCPDGVWLCTEVYSDLCGGDCTEVNFSLDSFVADGGPEWVGWHLFNGEGAFIADGVAQYSTNDPYYDWADCLPDGCYSLYVCAPTEFNGGAFDILFSDGWDVVEITPIYTDDCVGYNVLLSLNGECGQGSDDCDAGFEPNVTFITGHVEFENTSTYAGEASFYWSYGNGQSSDDMGGNVWYTENGEYEVCLTIVTSEGCTDTYCETILVDGFEEQCNGTEVNVVINTNYPEPGSDAWTVNIVLDGESLGTFPFITCFECPETIEFPLCLEDGCYELEFSSAFGINAEEIALALYLIGQEVPLGELNINYDEEAGTLQVGINDDCIDNVNNTFQKSIMVYPNPSNEYVQLTNPHTFDQCILTLQDAAGRTVLTEKMMGTQHTLSVSSIAEGAYTMKIQSEVDNMVKQLVIQH